MVSAIVDTECTRSADERILPRRVPLNLFTIPLGFSGLATAWGYAAQQGLAPPCIREVLVIIGAIAWIILLAAYLRSVRHRPRLVVADLTDLKLGPYASLILIAPLVLTEVGLLPYAPGVARTTVDVLIALIVLLGGWLTGQWIYGPLEMEKLHPGYFLPTVAGGLLAASAAGVTGQARLGEVLFGFGVISWLLLGSMILARLLFWPPLPAALTPTIALEVAPAAAAMLAHLSLDGDRIDAIAAGISGYGLLMVLAQLRLLPAYRRLAFVPGFWSFALSWAIVATAGLHWLADMHPSRWRAFSYIVLAAISLLVIAIAARTVIAISRDELLPAALAPADVNPDPANLRPPFNR
jgi:tellurite resistance protein